MPSKTFHSLLLRLQGQLECQMKPNFNGKSNLKVSCAVFQSEFRNLCKGGIFYTFLTAFLTFLKISQFWLKNSAWNLTIWLSERIWLHLIHAVFFIRNKVKSELVVFLIFPPNLHKFCFLFVPYFFQFTCSFSSFFPLLLCIKFIEKAPFCRKFFDLLWKLK